MTQPKVEEYRSWLGNFDYFGMEISSYDEKSCKLLDGLFALIEKIAPTSENGARTIWLNAERGPIEDFGSLEELIAEGEVENEQEYKDLWKSYFPDEVEWYELSAVELKKEKYRAITLRHRFVIVQDERREKSGFNYDIAEFVQWLVDSVKEVITMLKDGTYNDYINKNLPPQHKVGTIARKDFWDIWPERRTDFFKNILKEDIAEFCKSAKAQTTDYKQFSERMESMTANDFFRFCAMGYVANNYSGCDKTPKEQYLLHADGRDDGLTEINPDSPQEFREWINVRTHYGHPWEVCRGGNSTHISLCVNCDEKGYFLSLDGDAWTRTIETVKFYLALHRAEIPVFLHEAEILVQRLLEEEKIGIVPEGVMPIYCENYFPNEHIIDFINLPYEDREEFLPHCVWQELESVHLSE